MNKADKKNVSAKTKRIRRIITACVITAVLILSVFGFTMKTVNYSLSSDKIDGGLTIVFISDLHNCFYGGDDQSGLWDEIEKASPDLVLFGGDVIDEYGGTENALTIMEMAAEKYPCCYTPGNHEQWRDDLAQFKSDVRALGIRVLEGECAKYTIGGNKVAVYGILDSIAYGSKATQLEECIAQADVDCYNILLAHQPEQIDACLGLDGTEVYESGGNPDSAIEGAPFDLILSGHAHGGQWRIPFVLEQGILAPNQGLFPPYTNGIYDYGDSVHIISRGLARPLRMIVIPRIFNRPEFTVIEVE